MLSMPNQEVTRKPEMYDKQSGVFNIASTSSTQEVKDGGEKRSKILEDLKDSNIKYSRFITLLGRLVPLDREDTAWQARKKRQDFVRTVFNLRQYVVEASPLAHDIFTSPLAHDIFKSSIAVTKREEELPRDTSDTFWRILITSGIINTADEEGKGTYKVSSPIAQNIERLYDPPYLYE